MTRAEIIEEVAGRRQVEQIVHNICKTSEPELFDLAQMIYEILLTYDETKIIDLYEHGQLGFFIVRIVKNQYFSRNSPFYREYRKFNRGGVTLDNAKNYETQG